ncbi:hypothetical protein Q1695_000605 [Nippostrongylus brasiliensis]|nr:hypothetical protein Q1695_000605 [Nippostrongylus brasiliensis]
MLTALEASEDRVFSEVRAVALRLERMRNLQKAASTSGNTCPSKEPSTTDRVCPPRPEKPFTHGNMGTPRDQRGRKGGRPPQGSSKPQQRGNTGNPPIATPTQPNSRPSKPNTNQTFAKELQFRCAKSISRLRIKSKAYGKPCTCSLQLLGIQAKALVDSGSVLSIIPSGFFFRLISEGVDLDPLVTMVGPAQSTKVRDASGNSMSFLMRVEISVSLAGGRDTKVQFHVQKADKELILLGTNALQALGVGIQFTPTGAKLTHTGRKLRQVAIRAAKAAREITIPPLSVAKIEITHPCKQANEVFWSQDDRIGSGVCHVENGSTVVTAVNKKNQPWTIRKGQCLGEWSSDSWFDPKTKDIPGDMLEIRRADVLPEPARVNQILDILQVNKQEGVLPSKMKQLIRKYRHVFAVSDVELTQTHLSAHNIDVQGHPPIRQKTRPVPYGLRSEVDYMLRDLEQRRIIEASSSPWASPIVLVAKKDGGIRLCVDYREVNKATKKDSYPLPTIDVTLQNLKGKQWFTSLDLASGYWQV